MSDLSLLVAIVIINDIAISFLWVFYGANRLHEERRRHVEHVARMVDEYEMMRRTYGSVPIGLLIGRESIRKEHE